MNKELIDKLNKHYAKIDNILHRNDLSKDNHDESFAYTCPICDVNILICHGEEYFERLIEIYIDIAKAPYLRNNENIYAFVCKCPHCNKIFWFHCSSDFYDSFLFIKELNNEN